VTDLELVRQAQAGDLDSFGKLVDRHRGAVHGLAYHWTGSFADAEDIAQEACVRAYLHLKELREPDRFAAWLWQLARNECRQWRRRQRPDTPLEDVEDFLASADPSPTEELERSEVRRLLDRSLRSLSDNNRLVISLHYLGGLSYHEIAQFLDLSHNAVAARLHRARKELEVSLMDTIGDSLKDERLDYDFTRKVLEQARKRAQETQSLWQREAFAVSVEQGLGAARQLQDTGAQIEMLSMLGEAGTSWLGGADKAVESYESALAIARSEGDRKEEARLLGCLCKAHLRHGEWERLRPRAVEAVEVCRAMADLPGQAQAQAALDLAEALPGRWRPGEAGGYAAAAFPCTADAEGLAWGDVVAERRYSWGCPSRCAALMHLYRPRRFLGPSLEVGATWEDRVRHVDDVMSWGTDGSEPEPVARSEVRSRDAVVVTSAGRFEGCLEVRTVIEPPDGGTAAEHSTRSYCGERTVWYAPGVGLVQVRHQDQNGQLWVVQLVGWEGQESDRYFPLDTGRQWRYRWPESLTPTTVFEDVCQVVGEADGVVWLASATVGGERTEAEAAELLRQQNERARGAGDMPGQAATLETLLGLQLEGREAGARRDELLAVFDEQLEMARETGDLAGQAGALRGIVRYSAPGESGHAACETLKTVCERLGDARGCLTVSQVQRGGPDEAMQVLDPPQLRERLELARGLGDATWEAEQLRGLADRLRHLGKWEEVADLFEDQAAAAGRSGDVRGAAEAIAEAELSRAFASQRDVESCAWWIGEANLGEREDGSLAGHGSSRWRRPEGKDVKGWRTPMTDLYQLAPLMGLEVLGGEVGQCRTDWLNTSLATRPRYCESMRVTGVLETEDEAVDVAAGRLTGCARIGVSIATSDEERRVYEEPIEEELGYYAGTKQVWYAPDVGLVKLVYQHRNGLTTEVELVEYEIAAGAGGWLPMAVGNRWRYTWTEAGGGARFEDCWRVAAHRQGHWSIAFVTRAEVAGG